MNHVVKRLGLASLTLAAVIGLTPYFSTPSYATDNTQEIRNILSNDGWELVTIDRLDHWEYADFAARLASNPAFFAPDVVGAYDAVNSSLGQANLARAIVNGLAAAMQTGENRAFTEGYETKLVLLTYNHWHNENPCSESGEECWERVPEPNTHELVLATRPQSESLNAANQGPQDISETSCGRHVDWSNNIGFQTSSHSYVSYVREGSYLRSTNGRFRAVIQGDGNFVVYDGTEEIWASNSPCDRPPGFNLAMQSDGNLVIYDGQNARVWSSNTEGIGVGPYRLILEDDGNLVIYDSQNRPTWSWESGQ